MIMQLKGKFQSVSTIKEKVRILSVLPISWSSYKIAKEFPVSKCLANKTKQLVAENGILCVPKPKPRNVLPEGTLLQVRNFYFDPEVSREMPGMKDCISVMVNGKKEHQQKRLILGNLKEIYQFFSELFSATKISFSRFAMERPKSCVLAGAAGTHTVCVCLIHENVNLMLSGAALLSMQYVDREMSSFSDFLKSIKCTSPSEDCHLRRCEDCSDVSQLKDAILNKLQSEEIESITYQQWVNVDRCALETLIKSTDQFVEELMEKLEALSPHHYICKQQATYFRQAKKETTNTKVVVVADFSENYSFVLQNSVQGIL